MQKSEEKTINEDQTEEKSNQDDDQTTEDTEQLVKGKFRNFFVKLFKRDTVADKKSEDPVKMSNCETKEEFEPEDKPEIPEDQKLKSEEVVETGNGQIETETTKLTEPKEEEQLPKTALANETSF